MTIGSEFAEPFGQIFDLAKQPLIHVAVEQVIDGMGHSPGDSKGEPEIIYGMPQALTAQSRRETDAGWIDTSDYILYVQKGSQTLTQRDLVRFPLDENNHEDSTTNEYVVMDNIENWGLENVNVFQTYSLRRTQIDRD